MKNLLMCLVVTSVGCSNMNIQLAGLRGAGDSSLAVVLDNTSLDKLSERKAEIVNIAKAIDEFLNDGKVVHLTTSDLKKELLKLIPDKYDYIVDSVLASISSKELDVDKIGKNNVLRMKAYLKGILNGADYYLDEFHPVEE